MKSGCRVTILSIRYVTFFTKFTEQSSSYRQYHCSGLLGQAREESVFSPADNLHCDSSLLFLSPFLFLISENKRYIGMESHSKSSDQHRLREMANHTPEQEE